ncbi:hypothetical protein [Streptomyces sp. NPDC048445]|uniref:hypothetical protein n=1 Tax=Streptomyces sp. NPDC048445 TaxID=3365553 RepID=UPI00371D5DEE
MEEDRPGSLLIILSDGDEEGRKWELEQTDHGTCTFRNQTSGTHLNFDGDPHVNKAGRSGNPREWQLRPHPGLAGSFHLVLPGGPVGKDELVFDASLLRVFPPQSALRPIRPQDIAQTWKLIPV